jgi:DNA (cytosine-5)-methyltransferase 1
MSTGFSFIDVFCGAGGFALGLVRAGFAENCLGVEGDRDCVETFRLNFPAAEMLNDDIREVDLADRSAELMVGGPPCQGFSGLNRSRAGDPRNSLSEEMIRCVEAVRPRLVVVENVPGFLDAPEGILLRESLHDLGYTTRAEVVNCADYGVPQRRKRAIVAAATRGFALPWPQPTHGSTGRLPRHRTVGDAFAMLSAEPDGRNWHRDPGRDPAVHLERFRAVPEGGSRRDLPADLVLDCWRNLDGYYDVLGRLHWHRPATTVRTEFFRPEKGRFLHPRADRPISPREAARLQSFPDGFVFPEHQTLTSVARQIGNAMPPALAEAIGRAALMSLRSGSPRRARGRVQRTR